ncbi:ABC transporter permease [Sulfoacidibacillus thermotolerans]|uniref:Peptide ABC transporter permease n=1 Tax=Sulfoacidibacillus thermotolerans TaxID=1765684 RepID=A0A2U3DA67_SULT2|nr:ABC transporter permease [Sulfoacidibacillus thermotolerans]PWI58152.1 peptide ABC transporter permease [Sulfoacidibacillus thermotolerans]
MKYFVRKTGFLLLTLWIAITLNFILPRLMPGNPAQAMMAKYAQRGPITPTEEHALALMLGLPTGSLWSQYWQYLSNILHGNFGVSYSFYPLSVMAVIANALPWTLILVGLVTILQFIVGTLLGIYAAWHRGKKFDSSATVLFSFTSALPYFWVALMFIYVFGYILNWFPISGGYSGSLSPTLNWNFAGSAIYHSVLPALTIFITSIGGSLLGMRNNMINTLGEDYILLARAEGLSETTVAIRYAARNALLPIVTNFAMSLGMVVGGSLLMETVFAYPGMGYLLATALNNQDYPLLQALFFFITLSVLLANFMADVIYGVLDPRVRKGGAR